MSKSLYQYKINEENKTAIENAIVQSIMVEKYKPTKEPFVFVKGNGWFTAKKKIEFKVSGELLSICAWKVVAPVVPMWEMGCSDLKDVYGVALNAGINSSVLAIIGRVKAQFPMNTLAECESVTDDFLYKR